MVEPVETTEPPGFDKLNRPLAGRACREHRCARVSTSSTDRWLVELVETTQATVRQAQPTAGWSSLSRPHSARLRQAQPTAGWSSLSRPRSPRFRQAQPTAGWSSLSRPRSPRFRQAQPTAGWSSLSRPRSATVSAKLDRTDGAL